MATIRRSRRVNAETARGLDLEGVCSAVVAMSSIVDDDGRGIPQELHARRIPLLVELMALEQLLRLQIRSMT